MVDLDKILFELNDKEFEEFNELLDSPIKDNPKLKELMKREPLWSKKAPSLD